MKSLAMSLGVTLSLFVGASLSQVANAATFEQQMKSSTLLAAISDLQNEGKLASNLPASLSGLVMLKFGVESVATSIHPEDRTCVVVVGLQKGEKTTSMTFKLETSESFAKADRAKRTGKEYGNTYSQKYQNAATTCREMAPAE